MTHLEQLIYEYYDWQGCIVKANPKVGRREKGGWEMELDIVAFHPDPKYLLHIEPSLDADTWKKRGERFRKKFESGKKYIKSEVFAWLEKDDAPIEQIAILPTKPQEKQDLGGDRIMSVEEFVEEVRSEILRTGKISQNAIPEQYPLLRTVQLFFNGYSRMMFSKTLQKELMTR